MVKITENVFILFLICVQVQQLPAITIYLFFFLPPDENSEMQI